MGCAVPTRRFTAETGQRGLHKSRRVHTGLRRAAILGPEGGEYIPIRKPKRRDGVPGLELAKEDAVQIQLAVSWAASASAAVHREALKTSQCMVMASECST